MKSQYNQEFVCIAVGNIVEQLPYKKTEEKIYAGTKHFRPGTKVYLIDWFPGTCERVVVIGQARKSKKLIKITMSVGYIENFRIKNCFNPAIIRLIKEHILLPFSSKSLSQEFAETLCRTLPIWQANLKK